MLLYCNSICCDTTCDTGGADEIYFIGVARRADGSMHSMQSPCMKIDEPDEDSPHCIDNTLLMELPLAAGESAVVWVTLMSHDGTDVANIASTVLHEAAGVCGVVGAPQVAAVADAVSRVVRSLGATLGDADDIIGAFMVEITCVRPGAYAARWHPVYLCTISEPGGAGWHFRMNGDGSNYAGWYSVV